MGCSFSQRNLHTVWGKPVAGAVSAFGSLWGLESHWEAWKQPDVAHIAPAHHQHDLIHVESMFWAQSLLMACPKLVRAILCELIHQAIVPMSKCFVADQLWLPPECAQ
jgi:hypothetical protein